jgi:hypothetical protein
LVGVGIPEYEAKRLVGRVKDGGILLSVHCDSREEIEAAMDSLEATGAQDIASAKEVSLPDVPHETLGGVVNLL